MGFHDGNRTVSPHDKPGTHGQRTSPLDRRSFLKAALLIGGAAAFGQAVAVQPVAAATGHERVTFAERHNRQHAWHEFVDTVNRGPHHHLLLHVNLRRDGAPTAADRRQVTAGLDELERAFDWSSEGLLVTVGYSRDYFDRFADPLPAGIDLMTSEEVIAAADNPKGKGRSEPDHYDAVIHLASNNVSNLLAAELALWGALPPAEDLGFTTTLEGVFTRPTAYPARRVGFVGDNLPKREIQKFTEDIPEGAPLAMGFAGEYEDNQPTEDDITLVYNQQFEVETGVFERRPPGIFAQGTTMHVSHMFNDLGHWYGDSVANSVANMFSSHHSPELTGVTGGRLIDSGTNRLPKRSPDTPTDVARETATDAREYRTEARALDALADAFERATARALAAADDRDKLDALEDAVTELEDGFTEAAATVVRRSRVNGVDDARLVVEDAISIVANSPSSGELSALAEALGAQTERVDDLATNTEGIGHGQKSARARTDHGRRLIGGEPQGVLKPAILRRDFVTVDGGKPGLHFVSLQRHTQDFVDTRRAMNFVGFRSRDGTIDHGEPGKRDENLADHGILQYLVMTARANYLLPPLTLRALPPATGIDADVTLSTDGDLTAITLPVADIDANSVQVGTPTVVTEARGAFPVRVDHGTDGTTFFFESAAVDGASLLTGLTTAGIPVTAEL